MYIMMVWCRARGGDMLGRRSTIFAGMRSTREDITMKARRTLITLAILAGVVNIATSSMPNVQCTATAATGARCAADCPDNMQARCYASGTEAHCDCADIGSPGGNRKWGLVGGNSSHDVSVLQSFYTYLTTALATPGALTLSGDVSMTIDAIQQQSQSEYEAANNSYADHWESLSSSDREAMLAWIATNPGLH
jgi:hypothetical protein